MNFALVHFDGVDFRYGLALSVGGPCASSSQAPVGSHLDTLCPPESPPFTSIKLLKFLTNSKEYTINFHVPFIKKFLWNLLDLQRVLLKITIYFYNIQEKFPGWLISDVISFFSDVKRLFSDVNFIFSDVNPEKSDWDSHQRKKGHPSQPRTPSFL